MPVLKCFFSAKSCTSINLIWEEFKPWGFRHCNLVRVHLWLKVWSMKIILSDWASQVSSLFWTFFRMRVLIVLGWVIFWLMVDIWGKHEGCLQFYLQEDRDTAWPTGSVDHSTSCLFHTIAKPHEAREDSPAHGDPSDRIRTPIMLWHIDPEKPDKVYWAI